MGAGKEVAERLTVYVDCLSPLGKELKILNQPCAVSKDLCGIIDAFQGANRSHGDKPVDLQQGGTLCSPSRSSSS